MWRIVVGAHVFDIYSNPVDYGTSIWFYIPDNQFNCQIGSNAYVGNESAYGDSTAGTAYTWLIYSGIYSLETITISVATGGEAFGGASIVLPLNQPQLELEISPGNLPVFHGNVNPVPESIAVTLNVSLFDVQGCPIHHARFLLTTTYGYFEFTEDSDPEIPNIISSDNGFPHGMIRFFASGIPLGNPETGSPGELSVTLGLNLIGYDVSSSGTITLTRYPT